MSEFNPGSKQSRFVPESAVAVKVSLRENSVALGREFSVSEDMGKPKLDSKNLQAGSTFSGSQETPSGIRLVPGVKKILWSKLPTDIRGGNARVSFIPSGSPLCMKRGPVGGMDDGTQVALAGFPAKQIHVSLQNAATRVAKPEPKAAEAAFVAISGGADVLSELSAASVVGTALPAPVLAPEVVDAQFIEKLKALLTSKERLSHLESENKILREQIVAMGGEIALLKAEISIKKG